jgi:hypothetical protein
MAETTRVPRVTSATTAKAVIEDNECAHLLWNRDIHRAELIIADD